MFTGKEDMEAKAFRDQGWSISAIAGHLGRSREMVRNHLNGRERPANVAKASLGRRLAETAAGPEPTPCRPSSVAAHPGGHVDLVALGVS
jgi:predicted transcriptional regulator